MNIKVFAGTDKGYLLRDHEGLLYPKLTSMTSVASSLMIIVTRQLEHRRSLVLLAPESNIEKLTLFVLVQEKPRCWFSCMIYVHIEEASWLSLIWREPCC